MAILLLGPPDCFLPRGRPGALGLVEQTQREAAQEAGGLYASLREAMGGEGSIEAWLRQGLALKDRVHFSAEGYLRLARAGLGILFGRLESSAPKGDLRGAFELPAAAPRLLGRFEFAPAESAPASHPIYTFRSEDGRLFITDDPSKVQGLKGAWVGRGPEK